VRSAAGRRKARYIRKHKQAAALSFLFPVWPSLHMCRLLGIRSLVPLPMLTLDQFTSSKRRRAASYFPGHPSRACWTSSLLRGPLEEAVLNGHFPESSPPFFSRLLSYQPSSLLRESLKSRKFQVSIIHSSHRVKLLASECQ
jgi:hypothetical protein